MRRTTSGPQDHRGTGEAEAWALPSLREPRYSQSLERGLAILGCFTQQRPVLGIADIADELGMSRSTTHRYATTLLALGYLEQGISRKYRLSLKVADLGMSALSSTDLAEHARPHLQALREESSSTVSLAILDGADILCIDRIESPRRPPMRAGSDLTRGTRLPAYCTAMGKVLLAALAEDDLRSALSETQLIKRGPNTITTKKGLRAALDEVREEGFAVSDEELARGLIAIACPVRSEGGQPLAAMGISADSGMISMQELQSELGPHLLAAADRLSSRFGHRRRYARDRLLKPMP